MKILPTLALLALALTGCRILSGEVACERNRDCPGEIRFCSTNDGGVGQCVEEDPFPDPPPGDAGFNIPFPDAGQNAEPPGLDAGDAG